MYCLTRNGVIACASPGHSLARRVDHADDQVA
jgi:hypothetical protein